MVILSHSRPFQCCFGPFGAPVGTLNGPSCSCKSLRSLLSLPTAILANSAALKFCLSASADFIFSPFAREKSDCTIFRTQRSPAQRLHPSFFGSYIWVKVWVKSLFKLESFSPGTADRCGDIKMGNGGQPVGESCRDLLGNFLRRQVGCWAVGEWVGWVAQVFLHPGQLQDQHRQGDQTH